MKTNVNSFFYSETKFHLGSHANTILGDLYIKENMPYTLFYYKQY